MCFHTREEYEDAVRQQRVAMTPSVSGVVLKTLDGEFSEAYTCDAHSAQSVANTIRNLRAWHPGTKIVSIADVNATRVAHGLDRVEFDSLPAPTGPVPPTEDHLMESPEEDEDEPEEDEEEDEDEIHAEATSAYVNQ